MELRIQLVLLKPHGNAAACASGGIEPQGATCDTIKQAAEVDAGDGAEARARSSHKRTARLARRGLAGTSKRKEAQTSCGLAGTSKRKEAQTSCGRADLRAEEHSLGCGANMSLGVAWPTPARTRPHKHKEHATQRVGLGSAQRCTWHLPVHMHPGSQHPFSDTPERRLGWGHTAKQPPHNCCCDALCAITATTTPRVHRATTINNHQQPSTSPS